VSCHMLAATGRIWPWRSAGAGRTLLESYRNSGDLPEAGPARADYTLLAFLRIAARRYPPAWRGKMGMPEILALDCVLAPRISRAEKALQTSLMASLT